MTDLELKSLLCLILEDIRGNWADNIIPRISKALYIAYELSLKDHLLSIAHYIAISVDNDDWDGRYFRKDWNDGGYYNPPFEIINDWLKMSLEYQQAVVEYLTYPESIILNFNQEKL